MWHRVELDDRILLEEGARIVVIGGGPAGSFFAIHLLRQAKQLGKAVRVTILERHKEFAHLEAACSAAHRQGCNYCAGGISPRLYDFLRGMSLELPKQIIQSEIRSITVQGYWKNIELDLPPGRQMFSVYRGSRPKPRDNRYDNFDAFLLEQAIKEGVELVTGDATGIERSDQGKPLIQYKVNHEKKDLEADFAVLACGVNHIPGRRLEENNFFQSLRRYLPEFVPPRLRPALISELELEEEFVGHMEGEIYFVEYGTPDLKLEMCSLVPKGKFVTVVLLGPTINRMADHSQNVKIVKAFLELPHIRKLLPRKVKLVNVCVCHPNIVVGTARNPFGERIAIIGDLVTSRRYKDGIFTAAQTAVALANTLLQTGVDRTSLKHSYWPVIARIRRDNLFGQIVFFVHGVIFGVSVLSRVFYQAVITEKKAYAKPHRRLESILWRIASGDDSYQGIFAAMIHPATIWRLITGGLLITVRNCLTEWMFGLRWQGVGRFTTAISIERLQTKRGEFMRLMAELRLAPPEDLEFERMYSIKIKAPQKNIINELGRFGENDRGYFKPQWVQVKRISGSPNVEGCIIKYEIIFTLLNFSVVLEKNLAQRCLVYRVRDGFARGGILIFEIEEIKKDLCLLSIYVAFDFARGRHLFTRPFWFLFRCLFPAFVHDVLWNYSLCQLKDIAESKYVAEIKIESVLRIMKAQQPKQLPAQSTSEFSSRRGWLTDRSKTG